MTQNKKGRGMDPDSIVKEWVANLRSGQYEQAKMTLRSDPYDGEGNSRFCCLGILCNQIDPSGWRPSEAYPREPMYEYEGETRSALLPDSLRLGIGMSNSIETHLAAMNDNGATFADIADEIEKLYQGNGNWKEVAR